MLNYTDLSPAKQKYIDLVEIFFPDIAMRGEITYQEIKDIHEFFCNKRKEDKKFKVSKPLWLITNNAKSRGLYFFPSPDVEVEENTSGLSEMELIYRNELSKFGIKPKK